ncbi:hypothetical protein GCM10017044_17130 [Kordiimonas sediminis]|uniref:Sulphotransferase Stf0 domain-containing protein n=1 Tax=Kordiimonas sediminis TaxID=1735581 RepID=A0A919E670_9PROT|nr:Stf0 family sulfotransferase [Kordiimonas sediminis]GHF23236.1 hypothetical protein GCM10017044_17130 [Kordiimonas sediminis]
MTLQTTAGNIADKVSAMLSQPENAPTKFYCLVSTPRSGSKLFCDMMTSTGLAGDPKEWVNIRYIREFWKQTAGQQGKFQKYLDTLIPQTTTENGVFALNLHVDQHQFLLKNKINIFKRIKFDKIYYLRREDKIAQAISLAKARATDVWGSSTRKPADYDQKVAAITNAAILQELQRLVAWEEIAHSGMQQFDGVFNYEDFAFDPEQVAYRRIFDDLGIDLPAGVSFTTTKQKQATARDDERRASLLRSVGLGE